MQEYKQIVDKVLTTMTHMYENNTKNELLLIYEMNLGKLKNKDTVTFKQFLELLLFAHVLSNHSTFSIDTKLYFKKHLIERVDYLYTYRYQNIIDTMKAISFIFRYKIININLCNSILLYVKEIIYNSFTNFCKDIYGCEFHIYKKENTCPICCELKKIYYKCTCCIYSICIECCEIIITKRNKCPFCNTFIIED